MQSSAAGYFDRRDTPLPDGAPGVVRAWHERLPVILDIGFDPRLGPLIRVDIVPAEALDPETMRIDLELFRAIVRHGDVLDYEI